VVFVSELLSIKEISQELGIPQSTLRYYRDLFMDYLPAAGEGKKKRFYPEAVVVFQTIAKGMHKNKSADDIASDLNQRFTRFIDVNEAEEKTQESSATYSQKDEIHQSQALTSLTQLDGSAIMAVVASQNQALQQIAATISIVNEQQEELHNLKQEVNKLEERLEKELTDHFQLVDTQLRQAIEQRETKKTKSFWQRLFA
jgi:transposase-like protein